MRSLRFAVTLFALLLVAATIPVNPVGAQSPTAAPRHLASVLKPFVDDHTLAGAVILVASKDKVLDLEAVGYADIAAKKPMRTDNLFWIASMTKSFTATALMMLVDEGKVNVDDPVEKYLPEFGGQMLAVPDGKGKAVLNRPAHLVLVRNLLNHTGGLVRAAAAGKCWDMTSLRTAVESYAAHPLQFEPGSKYEYSNAGINTAGRIIEVVSGMPYEVFMAKRLFEPLRMNDTTFWPTPAQFQRLAKAYKPTPDKSGLVEMPTFPIKDPRTGRKSMAFPAGGLFSTATDVSFFCRMILGGGILNGKRYLSEKAIRQMSSTQTGNLPVAYGFGWATERKPGGPFGHAGAHKTEMHIFPQFGLITVFMVQHGDWRNEEGKKILSTFQQAAIKAFHGVSRTQPAATPVKATGPKGTSSLSGRPRYYYPVPAAELPQNVTADVCVYGATPGGVTAAIQARRMGKQAILVEFGRNVGGMTASGLSDTDGGEPAITGGLAAEFYRRVGQRSKFRPSQAERTFRAMLAEAKVPLYFEHRLKSVSKQGNRITEILAENGNRFRARMFVDATYEGDLLARAGVSYTVGREGNAKYGESINGVIYGPKDNFDHPVAPYRIPGQPDSGLVSGVDATPPAQVGEGDRRVQAYNFRMWLVPAGVGRPFPKPPGYDPSRYALLLRYIAAGNRHVDLRVGDNNNHHLFNGAFSTDDIGANYDWPEADYATRERIYQEHVTYQQGLMYFLANDSRVPAEIREKVTCLTLPKDEFVATGGWPHQLYVREARRMLSPYVMTEHNGTGKVVAEDPVALASYQMDSHNTCRLVVDGKACNEGQTYKAVVHPLPLSYRAICPRQSECGNLLVVFCVSASHIGLSTLRMEPVLMITGQSAGTAACLATDAGCDVQRLPYPALRQRLLRDGQILDPPQPAS